MFVAVGIIGAILLVASVVFDDALDGLLPDIDWLSGPIIGAFLTVFGAVGWALETGADAPRAVALAGGVVGGAGLGYVVFRSIRALVGMPTDATPKSSDLVGAEARVVTPVQADGVGEVLVTIGGHRAKYTATAARDLAVGTSVVVVAVVSPTKVVVQAADEFWN